MLFKLSVSLFRVSVAGPLHVFMLPETFPVRHTAQLGFSLCAAGGIIITDCKHLPLRK